MAAEAGGDLHLAAATLPAVLRPAAIRPAAIRPVVVRPVVIHPAVTPQPGDIEVLKKRVSAFAGSDLEVVLRSLDVGSLVLTGIATSGVVLSTLRQAADLDYDLVVLRDACTDSDDEVHRVLTYKVFPRQAAVIDTDQWVLGVSGR